MKKINLNFFIIFILLITLSSCDNESEAPVEPVNNFDLSKVLNDYVDNVVIKTYFNLKTKTEELKIACDNFVNNPSQENLNIAAEVWYEARINWELSEAFLFGPVSYLSIDPSMDSWPVDEKQLEIVLNSSFELNPDFVRNGLGYSLRGFHTLEYFLFTEGNVRDFSTISERGRLYSSSVATVLAEDAANVYEQWVNIYGNEFKNAGKSGSRYASINQAMQEIIDGIITIVDEVGNGKISEPFITKDVNTVESQYSWNSLTDFSNNIIGVRNAYNSDEGIGLDDYIKFQNAQLNNKVLQEIDDVILKIKNIPEPFRNNLNANVEIQNAIDACNKLLETFVTEVKPLINQ